MTIQGQSDVNPVSIKGVNQVPIRCQSQSCTTLAPIHWQTLCQSHINQVPILCLSYQSYANLVPFLCKFIANPLLILITMWCQSNANMVPIWGQFKANGLPISHNWGVNALQMWCQSANPMSIHCKSETNHRSITNLLIQYRSSFNLPIHYQSIANPWPIYHGIFWHKRVTKDSLHLLKANILTKN